MAERWLFIDGAATFGGHEVMLLRFVGELSRQRLITPRILARRGSVLRDKAGAFATTPALPERTPEGGPLRRIAHGLREVRTFFAALAAERPELCIVAEGCLLAQPWFTLLCRIARRRCAVYVPLVERAERLGFRSGRLRDRLVRWGYANLPHAWIVLTREQAESFIAWSGTRKPVLVLPNAVAPHIEALAGQPAATAGGPGPLRILVLGRLDAWHKGLDLLLDHLEFNPRTARAVRVSLVGDGPFRQEIEQRIARFPHLQQSVSLQGWSDAVTAYQAHDVLLLPSRFEGVPLVMLEAMALGLPVVASDLAGTRAYLSPECLFPVGDMAHAFAILDRLRDAHERRRIAQRNRATFARRASGAAFADAVRQLSCELPGAIQGLSKECRRSSAAVRRQES